MLGKQETHRKGRLKAGRAHSRILSPCAPNPLLPTGAGPPSPDARRDPAPRIGVGVRRCWGHCGLFVTGGGRTGSGADVTDNRAALSRERGGATPHHSRRPLTDRSRSLAFDGETGRGREELGTVGFATCTPLLGCRGPAGSKAHPVRWRGNYEAARPLKGPVYELGLTLAGSDFDAGSPAMTQGLRRGQDGEIFCSSSKAFPPWRSGGTRQVHRSHEDMERQRGFTPCVYNQPGLWPPMIR